jgi:hypothetical protein
MSNRQLVIDFISKLPEDTPLSEIARKIDFIAGIRAAEEEAERGEVIPAEDARVLVDKWARQ